MDFVSMDHCCLYTSEYPPLAGGIATVNHELALALSGEVEKVTVYCPNPPKDELTHGPGFFRVKVRGTQDPDDVFRWFRIMGRATADRHAMHCVTEPAPVLGLLFRILFRRPIPSKLTILLHGTELLRWRRRKWLVRALSRLSRQARIFVPSVHIQALFVEVLGPEVAIPEVLPYATPKSCIQAATSRKKKDAKDAVVLLTVARIHPRKGQLDVINALRKIDSKITANVHYRIVGEARKSRKSYLEQVRQAAAEAEFEVSVEGPLYGQSLMDVYSSSDLFIMASREDTDSVESFGLVYLEAAAFGLPIVATKVGGVEEACGEAAAMVEPHSVTDLAETLERLLEDLELRRSLGEAAVRMAQSTSWSEAAKCLVLPRETSSLVSI
jgi:glycosyltransferase involved in cell wall biosynthesis